MSTSRQYRTTGTEGGMVRQSGAPEVPLSGHGAAHGHLTAGVVVATYVPADGEAFPEGTISRPAAVYCDVLCLSSNPLQPTAPLIRVPVAGMGLHEGRIWAPRAARQTLNGDTLDLSTVDPRNLDGDWVLVQFLDNNLRRPIITCRAPHPQLGVGNDDLGVGHRERLKLVDGQPDLQKHRGVFHGVDAEGNFVLDASRAHAGEFTPEGAEVPEASASSGNITMRAASTAKMTITGVNPDGTVSKFLLTMEDGKVVIQLGGTTQSIVLEPTKVTMKLGGDSLSLENSGGAAVLSVGDGSENVVAHSTFKNLVWGIVMPLLRDHIHPAVAAGNTTAVGSPVATTVTISPSPTLAAIATTPSIDLAKSTKLKMPQG